MFGPSSHFIQGGEIQGHGRDAGGPLYSRHWRVNPRLTLNLGLRWDPSSPYPENEGRIVCFTPGAPSLPDTPMHPWAWHMAATRQTRAVRLPDMTEIWRIWLRAWASPIGSPRTARRAAGGFGVYYTPFMSAFVYMHIDRLWAIMKFNDVSLEIPGVALEFQVHSLRCTVECAWPGCQVCDARLPVLHAKGCAFRNSPPGT